MQTTVLNMPELEKSLRGCTERYINNRMYFCETSTDNKKHDHGHWHSEILSFNKHFMYDYAKSPFIKNHSDIEIIWNFIQEKIGKRTLAGVYIDAYTYGADSSFHQEEILKSENNEEPLSGENIIVYLNESWNHNWGGDTAILNEDNDIEIAVLPRKNRVLVFDSTKIFSSRPLSRDCPDLRKTLVFKTASNEASTKEIDFIYNLMSEDLPSFYMIYNMIFMKNIRSKAKEITLSALYHKVYTYPNIERETVRNLIGPVAEQIVYDYHNGLNTNTLPVTYIELAKLIQTNVNGTNNSKINELILKVTEMEKEISNTKDSKQTVFWI